MQSVSLNLTQLKKDAFKKDPSFKQNYLLNENNFNQICSNHKLLCDIFKGLIHSNNIDAINFIIDSDKIVFDDIMIQTISNYKDKWLFDKIKLYMKDFSLLLQRSIANNNEYIVEEICEKYKTNINLRIDNAFNKICENYKNGNSSDSITLNIIKLYNYELPHFVFQSDFHIENIFRIWINAVFELGQENKLDKLRNMCKMLIKNNKPNYFKIILNDYNLVDTIYDSVELKLSVLKKKYRYNNIISSAKSCCELLDCLKFDFTNFEISKKIFSILTYHFNFDNKEVCKFIDEILEKQKSTIIYNHDEFKINYNEKQCSYNYEFDDNTNENNQNVNTQNCFYSLDVMKNIIKSNNIELFKLLLSKGYYNTNINEWFKYIIFYSNFNFFDYYFNIYSEHFDLENLNLVWEKKCYGKDIMEFTLYFAEKYDSNTFVVDFENYEIITDCYDIEEQEYSSLVKLRPELDNEECYYLFFSTKNTYQMINLINDSKNKNFVDNYYSKLLYLFVGLGGISDRNVELVKNIIEKYSDPLTYKYVDLILIESAERKNRIVFELVFNFFSPHFDITFDDHNLFESLFEIDHYFHPDQINFYLGLLNGRVGNDLYQVYYRTENYQDGYTNYYINGYRIGDDYYGNTTNEIIDHQNDINHKVGTLEEMEKCQILPEEINICPICDETESNIISTCKHQFCYNCIIEYERSEYNISCPYCRQNCYPFKHILKEIYDEIDE
jgi:hypothetical protein